MIERLSWIGEGRRRIVRVRGRGLRHWRDWRGWVCFHERVLVVHPCGFGLLVVSVEVVYGSVMAHRGRLLCRRSEDKRRGSHVDRSVERGVDGTVKVAWAKEGCLG